MKKSAHPVREDLPYRDCVGICLFNTDNKLWIGDRYASSELIKSTFTWQMPQGGIDKGEDPLTAAKRELFEETSVHSISLIKQAEDWFSYDLPDELLGTGLKGKYRGQRQLWFAFRFEGQEDEINVVKPGGGKHPQEFQDWRWEELEKVPALVIPFKRGVYEQIVKTFADITD